MIQFRHVSSRQCVCTPDIKRGTTSIPGWDIHLDWDGNFHSIKFERGGAGEMTAYAVSGQTFAVAASPLAEGVISSAFPVEYLIICTAGAKPELKSGVANHHMGGLTVRPSPAPQPAEKQTPETLILVISAALVVGLATALGLGVLKHRS